MSPVDPSPRFSESSRAGVFLGGRRSYRSRAAQNRHGARGAGHGQDAARRGSARNRWHSRFPSAQRRETRVTNTPQRRPLHTCRAPDLETLASPTARFPSRGPGATCGSGAPSSASRPVARAAGVPRSRGAAVGEGERTSSWQQEAPQHGRSAEHRLGDADPGPGLGSSGPAIPPPHRCALLCCSPLARPTPIPPSLSLSPLPLNSGFFFKSSL